MVRSRADPPPSPVQAEADAIAAKIQTALLDLRQEIIAFRSRLASGTSTLQKDVRNVRFPIYLVQDLFGAGRGEPVRRVNDAASNFSCMQQLALDAARAIADLRAEARAPAPQSVSRSQQRPMLRHWRPAVAPPLKLPPASSRLHTIGNLSRSMIVPVLVVIGLLAASWTVAGLSSNQFTAAAHNRTYNGAQVVVDLDGKVNALSGAIAFAEGYYSPGMYDGHSLPYHLNNPGSLKQSALTGADSSSWQDTGLLVFPTSDVGWAALRRQSTLMLTGTSNVYNLSDDFIEVARKYADGDLHWGVNVANALGTSPRTSLANYVAAPSPVKAGPTLPALTASVSRTP